MQHARMLAHAYCVLDIFYKTIFTALKTPDMASSYIKQLNLTKHMELLGH